MTSHQPAGSLQAGTKKAADSFQDGQGKVGDRVLINVGGKRHETYISTISNYQDTRLFWIAETASKMVDFDPHNNEFFFDRHPGCFENILNFCRTGKLHCPNDVCGPLFEEELAFWGIDELQMEPCCWGTYTQHRNAHKHLKMFDGASDGEPDCQENDKNKTKSNGCVHVLSRWRAKTWAALEEPYSSRYAQVVALVNLTIILLSIASFCIETMPLAIPHDLVFRKLEYFYCGFFTLDFFLRLSCCPSYRTFLISLYTWIDFISILQFYVNFWANSDSFDFLFVLRLIRIFRLFRFFKNLSGMQVIGQTLKASARELFLLVLIVLIPMVIFSSLIYYAEKNLSKPTFESIPEAFWWAIITMTTVGYGDVTPKSPTGKVVNALCACLGVLILALPVSVIGSNFTLYYTYAQARLSLPKRTQPALVLADKSLVNTNSGGAKKDAGMSTKLNVSPSDADVFSRSGASSADHDQGAISRGLRGLADVVVELTVPMQRRQAISPGISPISFAIESKGRVPSLARESKIRTTSKGSTTSFVYPAITLPQTEETKEEGDSTDEPTGQTSRLLSIGSTHLEVPIPRQSLSTCHSEDGLDMLDSPKRDDTSNEPLVNNLGERRGSRRSDSPVRGVPGPTSPNRRGSDVSLKSNKCNKNNLNNNNNNNNVSGKTFDSQRSRKHGTSKLWRLFRPTFRDDVEQGQEAEKHCEPCQGVYRRPRNGTALVGLDQIGKCNGEGKFHHDRTLRGSSISVTVTDDGQEQGTGLDCGSPTNEGSSSPTFESCNWTHTSNV